MNYIFDTSFIIDALRLKKKAREVLSLFENTNDHLFTSSIIGFELFSGESSKKPDQARRIRKFLDYFTVIDVNWEISRRAGEIYRDKVQGLEVPDYIVAATAIEIGAQVVTLNKKHFQKIPGVAVFVS